MSLLGQNMDTLRKDEVEQTTEERKKPRVVQTVIIKPPQKSESHNQLI